MAPVRVKKGHSVAGVALNFTSVNPVEALYWSAVVNGLVAAPVMAIIMLIAGDARVMGPLTVPAPLRIAGWTATAIMLIAGIGFFVL